MESQKFICENCGSKHNGSYGSGRFCSSKCARSYSTKNESKDLKKAKCVKCGKNIYINKRASIKTCKCEKCKKEYHKPSDLRVCKICGNKYYKNQGGCNNEFCKNHTLIQIKTLIKYFNFNKEKLGTSEVENEYNKVRDVLISLYRDKNLSLFEIGKLFNCKFPNNLSKIFRYLKIKRRSRKETVRNAILNGRLKSFPKGKTLQFKTEYHKTWNNKIFFLRSSYETDYANELDKNKIDYEVESLRIKYYDSIKNTYRCAIPDFYMPSENLIVEIKSSYTLNIQNMKDRVKSYKENGYSVKVICDHKEIDIENMEV